MDSLSPALAINSWSDQR